MELFDSRKIDGKLMTDGIGDSDGVVNTGVVCWPTSPESVYLLWCMPTTVNTSGQPFEEPQNGLLTN